jgi:AcrR family transcriptional regulator
MTENAPKQSKSQRTRAAILAAAQRQFGENGYDRASIRDIASAAKIDPALVIRYFGNKDALFAEAADFRLALPLVTPDMRAHAGPFLVKNFLDIWEGRDSSSFVILLRSAASNAAAAQKLQAVFAEQVVPTIAALTGAPGAQQRAGLITSQMLGFALCRYILKLPPIAAMPPEQIIAQMGKAIQTYLDMPIIDPARTP